MNNEARFLFRVVRLVGRDPRMICVKETFVRIFIGALYRISNTK